MWSRNTRIILAALAAFGLLFGLVKANRGRAFDLAVTLRIQGRRSAVLGTLLGAASWPGFPPQSRIIPALVIAGWWLAGRRRASAFQLLAWSAGLLSTIVKWFVRRPRPLPPQVRVVVAPLGGTSFPSGHVLTYVVFYGLLAHLVSLHVRPVPVRRAIVAGLGGLIALVGPSRVQLGHHWPTDVLASYLLGLAYLLALVRLHRGVARRAVGAGAVAGGGPALRAGGRD
jgi:undecaprenyl-diphosphatase